MRTVFYGEWRGPRPRVLSADEAVRLIAPGDRGYLHEVAMMPHELLDALVRWASDLSAGCRLPARGPRLTTRAPVIAQVNSQTPRTLGNSSSASLTPRHVPICGRRLCVATSPILLADW